MITDTPQIITQFRGNRSYSYIDDSTHVAGEPDMNCVQLNCLAKPFNNPNVRLAAAMAINRHQYAKVIDEGVLPVSNGLFVPGFALLLDDASTRPTTRRRRPSWSRQAAKANGGPISFTYGSTNSPAAIRAAEYLQQAWQAVGLQGQDHHRPAERDHQQRAGRQVPGAGLAPVRSGRPRPQLHLLEHDHGQLGVAVHQHGPQRRPQDRAALLTGRPDHRPERPRGRLQDGEQAPGLDLPYLWTDRAVWAVIGNPNVQNFNNPTTPQGQPAFGMIGGSIWPTQIWIS